MPIKLTISHPTQLVIAVAEGDVARADVDDYLSAVNSAGALPYRKIFDVSAMSPTALSAADIQSFAARVRDYTKTYALGPIAIVVANDANFDLARQFGVEAEAARPLRVFRDREAARAWLDRLAPLPPDKG
jgi:hypothetical protein